jgi:hypothetical protein
MNSSRLRGTNPQRVNMSSGSEVQYSSGQLLESLGYHFDNSTCIELPLDATHAARQVVWESLSTWKLLLELAHMDSVADSISEQMFLEESNPIRDAFLTYPAFRRLLGLLRWTHWMNQEAHLSHPADEKLTASQSAYPLSGSSVPIDQVLLHPETLNKKDIEREHRLCKEVWALITQGMIAEAIDLCIRTGHGWRAGVLQAGAAHAYMADDHSQEGDPCDWVESSIMAGFVGLPGGTDEESVSARYAVKQTAKSILTSPNCVKGMDEFDTAMVAFLCGSESQLRKMISTKSSFAMNLWISLHSLKEEFAAHILGQDFMVSDRFSGVKKSELNAVLEDHIRLIVSSLDTGMSISSGDQFHQIQLDLILSSYSQVVDQLYEWVTDGIIRINGVDTDIDFHSATCDGTAALLVRSFATALVATLNTMTTEGSGIDRSKFSFIVGANLESLVSQLKQSDSLLISNQVVVDNLVLLAEDPEAQLKSWSWYLMQCFEDLIGGWTCDNAVTFHPILSLIETSPKLAVAVVRKLLLETVAQNIDRIQAHATGTSTDSGKVIAYTLGCVNSLWLTVQSIAKSTGTGIYLDVLGDPSIEDPDEAASRLVSILGGMMGEGLMALILADNHATHSVMNLCSSVPHAGHKLMSLQTALDSVNESEEIMDSLAVVGLFEQIIDRVSAVMDRNSLLEQQRANLSKLTGRAKPVSGQSVASTTDTRRQIIDAQRMIESTNGMIVKLADGIIESLGELLGNEDYPINVNESMMGLAPEMFRSIVKSTVDAVVEACVMAIAQVDDRARQEKFVARIRCCGWLPRMLGTKRIETMLQELV